jgi:hypothetical protein
MKNLLLLTAMLLTLNAMAFIEDPTHYQPNWEIVEITQKAGESIATVKADVEFCADEVVKFESETDVDQHGPVIIVRSLVRDNSHFKIFCFMQPMKVVREIKLGKNFTAEDVQLINDLYHF